MYMGDVHNVFQANVPASKSLSNRWLVLQHLSGGSMQVYNLSSADDTQLLQNLLSSLSQPTHDVKTFHCDNAGTVARFLTAVLSITEGRYIVTGSDRMKQRPIAPLVEALNSMGASITYIDQQGYFPISIVGRPLQGGAVDIDASQSSQFVSALMLIAPFLPKGLTINIIGSMVSEPYISMTADVLLQAGIAVQYSKNTIYVPNANPICSAVSVEPDWSAVAYLYNWVLLAGKPLYVAGLSLDSSQGDRVVADIYRHMGVDTTYIDNGIVLKRSELCASSFAYNFIGCPDLVPALVVACATMGIEGTFEGLDALPYKETDRIKVLALELDKLGINAHYSHNSLYLPPRIGTIALDKPLSLSPHADHRMAMAFSALLFLSPVDITISNPSCVAKSFPNYWHELERYSGLHNGCT
jgi:3-phosphoshikimate 1-carboxyvinyltransferase